MKHTLVKLTSRFSIVAAAVIVSFSFTSIRPTQLGVLLEHPVPGTTRVDLIAIPMNETEKINCHLAHGDSEHTYSEELYRSTIISQEDGANFCR